MGNANGKNIIDDNIRSKLQSFDGTGASFKEIIKDLTKEEKKKLDKYFEIWKLGCLYKLILNQNNDLGYSAPEIISRFEETEGAILKGSDPQAMMTLYYATKDKKYLQNPE